MAKLTPYVGTHSGNLEIWVTLANIGTGQFKSFGDYRMEFEGSYNFLGQSGNFDIAVSLTDQQPNSPTGPCTVTLNGNTDTNAHYQTQNGKLTVTTALNDVPIDLHVKSGGTQVDNISGHNLWIG